MVFGDRNYDLGKVPAFSGDQMANFSDQQLCTTAILLIAVMPLGLCHMNCDIGGCSALFQSTFSDLLLNGLESLCRSIDDVSKCMKDCHKIFFPHFISTNSTVYFLNEVCSGDFIYDITDENWKCIRQHFNRLLSCIATSNSMESLQHKHDNKQLLSCKKVLMFLDCPQEVLYNECEDEVVEIVSEAFQLGLKPLLETSCYKISANKASNLNVQPRLDTGYQKTAVCMDNYGDLARSCFDEYLEKAAHSELNSCSEDAETICNKPSSSIPCTPPSLIQHFYSSIFSYGKQDCHSPARNVNQLLSQSTPSTTENIVTPSTTENIVTKNLENSEETPPFMKDVDFSYLLPTGKVTHAPLKLNVTASTVSVDHLEKSYSTINSTSDYDHSEYDDVTYPSSSTTLPGSMNEESVLSDAPENKNITISTSYHTSSGIVFVSYAYMFSFIVSILI